MSLMQLLQDLTWTRTPLLAVAFGYPFFLRVVGAAWANASESRLYGHIASWSVALGLVSATFGLALTVYMHRSGVNLITDVDFLALLAPFWFGLGALFAGTRVIAFERLRSFPVLRRVWSLLMAGLTLFAAFLVLRHTYWVVFSGIMGFLFVAVVVWTVFSTLADRALDNTDEEPEDLLDEIAANSRRRLKRLSDAAAGPRSEAGPDGR